MMSKFSHLVENMYKYCRLCLLEEGTVKIFDSENGEESVSLKIMNSVSIKVLSSRLRHHNF